MPLQAGPYLRKMLNNFQTSITVKLCSSKLFIQSSAKSDKTPLFCSRWQWPVFFLSYHIYVNIFLRAFYSLLSSRL